MSYLPATSANDDIVEVLRWVHLGARTGVLDVHHGESKKHLHFVAGELYLTNTHPLAKQLPCCLRGSGGSLESSPVGVDGKTLSEGELKVLARRIAAHTATWQGDRTLFTENNGSPTPDLVGPLPTAHWLMETAAATCEVDCLMARLGGPDVRIVATAAADDSVPADLGAEEARLLSRLTRPLSLKELLSESQGSRRRRREALSRLWAVDLIRQADLRPVASAESDRRFDAPAELHFEADPAALAIWRDHFHLSGEPFALTPDPAFLFLSDGHSEALAGLKLSLMEKRGLTVMIGGVGTGKTTLVYSLLSTLDSSVETAYIANTSLSFDEMMQSVLQDLGVSFPSLRRIDLLNSLNAFLRRCAEGGRTVALVIDEAQNLSEESFEELRLLLNFETYKSKLLQIILVGQPELGARLRNPRLRQIVDRIAVRCHLNPLRSHEARVYIDHRLAAVGGSSQVFTGPALHLLVKRSRGIPRRINILCHNAMLNAFGRGLQEVSRSAVAAALREITGRRIPWILPR